MSWSGPAFTKVDIPPFPDKIAYSDKVFLLGSCFSEHISFLLDRYKYDVIENPFGILYNPVSMATCLERVVHKTFYKEHELVQHDGLFHSMDHHGAFSGSDAKEVLDNINHSIEAAHEHLKECAIVFLSPGTSIVFDYKPTSRIAGNCHKIPATAFEKRRISLDECHASMAHMYFLLKTISPKVRVIWTVSPVRHWRDGMIENQKSKATLILAVDALMKVKNDCYYFPAYEIMVDQLRSYRYYAEDLVHPSAESIKIIWEIFRSTYLRNEDADIHSMIEKIEQAKAHRILHTNPQAIQQFANSSIALIEKINKRLPKINMEADKQYFSDLLNKLT